MGLIRDLARWSVSNHYLYLFPSYLLEIHRDCAVYEPLLLSFYGSGNIDSFYSFTKWILSSVYRLTNIFKQNLASSTAIISGGLISKISVNTAWDWLLDLNHRGVVVSACLLTLLKLYITLTGLPRATYKGMMGTQMTRWIRWHWLTIIAGVGLKYAVEHFRWRLYDLPVLGSFAREKPMQLHMYLSLFLLFEASYGILAKLYVFWTRYVMKQRTHMKKKKTK